MQPILITGGTGFVGTHLIRHLNPGKANIIVLASGRSPSQAEPGVELHKMDIRNRQGVRTIIHLFRPSKIFHLAGISKVDLSWSDPRLTFEVNVLGAQNLFEAALGLDPPPRVLNVSTAQVYARSDGVLTEASPVGPDNPYAASKAMAELLLVQYRNCTAGGIITARSFNHTGPGQSPNFVLPSIASQLAEIEEGLRPPKLKLGNLDIVRDFTDVRDVVRAYDLLLERGKTGEVYNVCSGCPVRLSDILDKFLELCPVAVDVEAQPGLIRSNEIARIIGDRTKISAHTDWNPQISLQQTIEDLLSYWRARIRNQNSIKNC